MDLQPFNEMEVLRGMTILTVASKLPLMDIEVAGGTSVGFQVRSIEPEVMMARPAFGLAVPPRHREARVFRVVEVERITEWRPTFSGMASLAGDVYVAMRISQQADIKLVRSNLLSTQQGEDNCRTWRWLRQLDCGLRKQTLTGRIDRNCDSAYQSEEHCGPNRPATQVHSVFHHSW